MPKLPYPKFLKPKNTFEATTEGLIRLDIEGMMMTGRASVVHASGYGLPVPVVPLTRQYSNVCSSEWRVAQRVAHRVDRGVDVAKGVEEVP